MRFFRVLHRWCLPPKIIAGDHDLTQHADSHDTNLCEGQSQVFSQRQSYPRLVFLQEQFLFLRERRVVGQFLEYFYWFISKDGIIDHSPLLT